MAQKDQTVMKPTMLFGRRNILLLAASLVTLAAGYGVLVSGSASAAAVLLVVGYCILFPLALVL